MKDYSRVRGFNYQPGYAWNSYEAWRFFDAEVFKKELGEGKKYFPGMNAVRLWLSYDAFRYEEDRQAAYFSEAVEICAGYGCQVVPVLFNCWHDAALDNGGIYLPQMIPGSIWCANEKMYDSFIEKIVGPHARDERILAWDVCNEPYSYGSNKDYISWAKPYETAWLKKMCALCHEAGAVQPVGISLASPEVKDIETTADFVDIFLIHNYFRNGTLTQEQCDAYMDGYHALAEKYDKPLLATETCWGSLDDGQRCGMIRRALSAWSRTKIGFIVHALHYSHVADLHYAEDGPVGGPGNLAFILKDGSLRPGHGIFNDY